jgi:aspartyl-tRNA(Asn)/glutamyl-tRNA(Gln) amidotransferase subunit B
MKYDTVIGLEVHVQLNTATKIFCSCSTQFGQGANTQTCPVCLGLPGVLPVLNKSVLDKSILAGLALNTEISHYSKFDRKNYFYPDLPKAYQISQLDKPICENGYIEVKSGDSTKKIRINRLHMEEDAGKSIHSENPAEKVSYVDFNRTGTPLAEIVTEPDISSSDEAYEYLSSLRQIMKYLNVSDCNMEEGSLRCDVNISLKPAGTETLGTKVEIKNMNSFKAIKTAIEHEIERQTDMLDDNETIYQETRLWDADKGITMSMRGKEESHDYRYFPDPDLAPIVIDDEYINKIKAELPELPKARLQRFMDEYQLPKLDAEILTATRQLADYYENTVKAGAIAKKASNWIMAELLANVEDSEKMNNFIVTPEMLAKLLKLIENNTISGKIAKKVFSEMLQDGKDPEAIVEEQGLKQVTDTGAIEKIVDDVLAANQQSVEDFKNGKGKALGFLVGQVMQKSKGKANPQMVNEILKKKLG